MLKDHALFSRKGERQVIGINRPCKTLFRGQKTAEGASAEVPADPLSDVRATKLR